MIKKVVKFKRVVTLKKRSYTIENEETYMIEIECHYVIDKMIRIRYSTVQL